MLVTSAELVCGRGAYMFLEGFSGSCCGTHVEEQMHILVPKARQKLLKKIDV